MNTLVLLHGLASNSTRWWHYRSHTRLHAGWRLLFPDLRGHAGSNDRDRIGIAAWCKDLVALLDGAHCERAVIGGHCLGANIALHFAARYPERCQALVLVEPMPREALTGGMKYAAVFRPALGLLVGLVRIANALGIQRRELEPMNLEAWDRGVRAGKTQLAASPLSDLRSTPTRAYLQGLAAVTEPLPTLSEIEAPALVLLSTSVSMTDPSRARSALQRLPRAQIRVLQAGHWIPTEQPEAMCQAIDEWLMSRLPLPEFGA